MNADPRASPRRTSIIWFFVLLVAALTVIAHYAIQRKAHGLSPFPEDEPHPPSSENTEQRAR